MEVLRERDLETFVFWENRSLSRYLSTNFALRFGGGSETHVNKNFCFRSVGNTTGCISANIVVFRNRCCNFQKLESLGYA